MNEMPSAAGSGPPDEEPASPAPHMPTMVAIEICRNTTLKALIYLSPSLMRIYEVLWISVRVRDETRVGPVAIDGHVPNDGRPVFTR
jgi:hypothetical protein